MGVAKKRKRKVVVKGKIYLWVVKEDEDGEGHYLNICSDDKKFIVSYLLRWPEKYRLNLLKKNLSEEASLPFVIVKGVEFGGLNKQGSWQRVRTPIFNDYAIITSDFVRYFISWCLDEKKQIILVNYKGFVLNPSSTNLF